MLRMRRVPKKIITCVVGGKHVFNLLFQLRRVVLACLTRSAGEVFRVVGSKHTLGPVQAPPGGPVLFPGSDSLEERLNVLATLTLHTHCVAPPARYDAWLI